MTFQQRLKKVMAGGNLRVADLARWFERPHATVTSWVKDGYEPGGGPQDRTAVLTALTKLERLVAKKCGFPVPRLGPRQRIEHIGTIRAALR